MVRLESINRLSTSSNALERETVGGGMRQTKSPWFSKVVFPIVLLAATLIDEGSCCILFSSELRNRPSRQIQIQLSPSLCVRGGGDSAKAGPPFGPPEEEKNDEIDDDDIDDEEDNRIPTLFRFPEEESFDRYAACLAATEGLRKIRDREISKTKPGFIKGILAGNQEDDSEEAERANSQYIFNSSRIIRALGMTIPQFNQLGREIMADEELKEKVMEQAYLYRLSSSLSIPDNRVPKISDPKSSQLLNSHRRRRIQMFARSITEIESLRKDQLDRLRRALQIRSLPEGVKICDPKLMPLLHPKIRAVCEAFPLQAEDIVKKYGLNSDEFNEMLEQTKTNAGFRRKVENEMNVSKKTTGKRK